MSLSDCVKKHGAKLNMAELQTMAAEYRADGMSPDTAMLRAAADKVVELKAAQLKVVELVRAEADSRGVAPKPVPAVAPTPVAAEPARTKNPKSMTLEELDAELVRLTDALADPYIEDETEAKLQRRKTIVENQLLVKETEQAAAAGTRMTQKEIDAEAAVADAESIDFDEGQDNRTGGARTDDWAKEALQGATNGRQALAAVKRNGSRLEQMMAKWLEAVGVDDVKVGYADIVRTVKLYGADVQVFGHHINGEVSIYRGGENARVILHELFHAVTVKQLERVRELMKRTEPERRALLAGSGELRGLFNAYQQIERLMGEVNDNGMGDSKFTDVLEFVAEAMSDTKLQALMASIKSEQQPMAVSLWHKFITAIKGMVQSLLRVAADQRGTMQYAMDNSVFARMLEASAEVMRPGKFEPMGRYDPKLDLGTQYSLAGPMDMFRGVFNPNNTVRGMLENLKTVPTKKAEDPAGWEEQKAYAKMTGQELMRNAGRLLKDGLKALNTMRALGRQHSIFQTVQFLISQMDRFKQRIQTHFNLLLSPLMEGARRNSDAIVDEAVGMIESSMQSVNKRSPEFLEELSIAAHKHISGETRMYTVPDEETDYPVLNKEYLPKSKLTLEEFIEGVFIPNQSRTYKPSEAMLKAHYALAEKQANMKPEDRALSDLEKAYRMYESAMDSSVAGALHLLQAAEQRAARTLEDPTSLSATYGDGSVYKAMRKLRQLAYDMYKANSTIDSKKRRAQQLDPDVDALFESLEETLYGLITKNEPLASEDGTVESSENSKKILKAFKMEAADLRALLAPLQSEVGAVTDEEAKAKRVRKMRDDVFSGTHEARVAEQEALRAAQSIFSMYIPERRHGQYIMKLEAKDPATGKAVSGLVTMRDKEGKLVKQESSAVFDVWMDDNLTMLNRAQDMLNNGYTKSDGSKYEGLIGEGGMIDIDVQEYDKDTKEPVLDEDKKPVRRTIKAKLEWSVPERVNEFKTTINRIGPMEYFTASKVMGVGLTPKQREKVIKASTNADSAVRHTGLNRRDRPGYSTDFVRVLSDHLGGVASIISIQRYNDELQTLIGAETEWKWTEKDEEKLKAKRDELEKETAPALRKVISNDLDLMEVDKKNRTGVDMPDVKKRARDLVEFVLGSDQMEESSSWVNKARAVVTIGQLGATLASAITNLSSIPLHSFSYLATYNPKRAFGGGFGAVAAEAALRKSFTTMLPVLKQLALQMDPRREIFIPEEYYREQEVAARKNKDEMHGGYHLRHWEFMRRAAAEGVLGAQRYNELLSQRKHSQFGPKTSKLISHYMALFAATEEFNRSVTGLAAFELFFKQQMEGAEAEIAKKESERGAPLSAEEKDSIKHRAKEAATEQAVKAIFNTQGEYNQANRPMLFRSDLGALVGLYKTFIITTLELISALPPKGKAYFLGSLYAFSGAGGLPLWEELMVVLDVAAQKTGIGLGITKGNAERAFAEFARDMGEAMGIEGMDEVVMRGVLDTWLGTEIFGRAGVQVGLPGIGLMRAGSDFGKELEAATGAAGGAIKGASTAIGKIVKGDVEGAARAVPITLVRNFADAYAYAKTGHVENKRGQIVTKDVGVEDVLARMVGFYPSEMKWANDLVRREEYTKAFAKELSNEFIEDARQMGIRGDVEGLRENARLVREHNAEFHGTALEIKNYLDRRNKAIEEAKLTLRERARKALPESIRQDSPL